MILFVVGYMGAGKSGIGREAARWTGMRFADTDHEVEALHGATVAGIFAGEGEAAFRKSEREVLERLADVHDDMIVATGGGLPCEGDAMDFMNEVGRTVYLRLSPAKLLHRLRPGQARRPKLNGMDDEAILEYVERTLPVREEFYMRASMVIDCDALSDAAVCGYVADYARLLADTRE